MFENESDLSPLNENNVILAGRRGSGLFAVSTTRHARAEPCGTAKNFWLVCEIDGHRLIVDAHEPLLPGHTGEQEVYGEFVEYEKRDGSTQQIMVATASIREWSAMLGR